MNGAAKNIVFNPQFHNYSSADQLHPRIGYFFIIFPKVTETFNLREMIWLERAGCHLKVYSLIRPPTGQTTHSEALPFIARTCYGPWFASFDLFAANACFLLRQPIRYIELLGQIVGDCWRTPVTLLKSLAIFPKSVYFASLAKACKLDHLHATFGSHNATAVWIASQLTGIPYSITIDAYDLYVETTLLPRKLRESQFVITISAYNKRVMEARYGSTLTLYTHVIRRGIDLTRFKPRLAERKGQGDGPFKILCVASLEIKKGHRYLIQAMARLRDQGRRIQCTFIGEGPTGEDLRKQVAAAGLTEWVRFIGARTQQEVLEQLQAADAFVLPSIVGPDNRMEGIPNALMEAMACELPVIGTDLSGIPELVRDGENGLLVPPQDAHALAKAITRLQDDPDLAHRFGRRGRATVEADFNQEINIAALFKLYRRALAATGEKLL